MKFAGTVVLYNPEKEVIENMQTYLPFIDVLYVVDNSTKEYEFLEDIKKIEKVKYISLNGNKGIAKALKVATETAITEGYDFLLSMDQDSKFPTDDFKFIEEYLSNVDITDIGIVSISYEGYQIETENKTKSVIVDAVELITSGSFLNLKVYKDIDGYNVNLFIDFVDNDICYQFKEKGYELKLFPNIYLNHKLGSTVVTKFLWKKRVIVTHSPVRYYYMYRNYHFLRKYKKEYVKYLEIKSKEYSFKSIMQKFLFEKPHFKNLKMILRGIRDGKKGVLGPYQEKRGK